MPWVSCVCIASIAAPPTGSSGSHVWISISQRSQPSSSLLDKWLHQLLCACRHNRTFHYGLKYYLVVMGTSIVLINLSFVSNFIGKQRDYFALLALIVTFQVSTSVCWAGFATVPSAAPAAVISEKAALLFCQALAESS